MFRPPRSIATFPAVGPRSATIATNEVPLRKIAPERNQYRYYRMFIQRRGVFGGYAVCREWSRIGQPGTTREDWCTTLDQATAILTQRAAAKVRRGYTGWTGNAATTKGKGR
ncbi:WGR domain-containing protein [Thioalkalivibrio sp. ALE12]|uniref:WGR domain-containing protein n=1 Tax=Thioalkalivibrio sp. ALE12 TaxID=1158170 RepID=UPI0009DB1DA8|nr:WGR domain-containing protein [Thioalkalivibrio sp. ALE12]